MDTVDNWLTIHPVALTVLVIVVLAVAYGIWRYNRKH